MKQLDNPPSLPFVIFALSMFPHYAPFASSFGKIDGRKPFNHAILAYILEVPIFYMSTPLIPQLVCLIGM